MLKQSSSKIKKVLAILLGVLFVLSFTAVTASARGGGGHGQGGDYGIGEEGGYGPGGIYNTPYYEGNPNEDYAAVNQPDYAGDVYT
jgi:hypothetical protein